MYSVGDTSSLFATLNLCNDRLKAKDDSPQALSAKLYVYYLFFSRMLSSTYCRLVPGCSFTKWLKHECNLWSILRFFSILRFCFWEYWTLEIHLDLYLEDYFANFSNDELVYRAALACLGALYETVGRLVGRSYEDTFHIITKWLKTAEVRIVIHHFLLFIDKMPISIVERLAKTRAPAILCAL